MKNLIILSGAMGVGKTTIAKKLTNSLEKSVWLDGDWCWMQGNDWNFCQENKEMVINNINYLLKSFLKNSNFENIVFSWVLHSQEIWDLILNSLKDFEFNLYKFTIVCDEEILQNRLKSRYKDGEIKNLNARILETVRQSKMYEKLDTIKIDSSKKKSEGVIKEIKKYLNITSTTNY